MGQLGALEKKAGEEWDGAECEEASQLPRGIWEKRPAAKEEREEKLTMVGGGVVVDILVGVYRTGREVVDTEVDISREEGRNMGRPVLITEVELTFSCA
jgi:hypothetical protein